MSRPLLIFGAGGQVGGTLVAAARAAGRAVVGLDRAACDIADGAAVEQAVAKAAPGLIVNAAAFTDVDRAEGEADAAFRVNRDGAGLIARAAAGAGAGLIHLSTDYVFDGAKTEPYDEDDPVRPLNVYGASKAAGEAAVRAAGGRHLILRTSWVFSARGRNFFSTLGRRVAGGQRSFRMVDDQHGGPTPAGAIAGAILRLGDALQADGRAGGTYHFSGHPAVTPFGFARRALGGHPGIDLEACATAAFRQAAIRPANSVLSCHRIGRDFGLDQPDWRQALAQGASP